MYIFIFAIVLDYFERVPEAPSLQDKQSLIPFIPDP